MKNTWSNLMNGLRRWIPTPLTLTLLLLVMLAPPVSAVAPEDVDPVSHAPPAMSRIDHGRRLRKDQSNAGFALGAGFGVEVFGSEQEHDLVLVMGRYGRVFTDVLADGYWYGGNFEVLAELVGGVQINPDTRMVVGLSGLVRYNFNTGRRWVPYVDGGFGLGYTDIDNPDLSTDFEFITQVGAGTRYFFGENTALVFQYRWFHLSNAGIDQPNNGTNTQMFYLGVDWFL